MRRRYVYALNAFGEVEAREVGIDYQRHEERQPVYTDRYMEGDRATDGTDIGSRTKRRDYMRAHGLADAGDFKEHWAKAEAQRFSAKQDRPQRVEAIRKAMYEMQKGRK